MSEIVVPPFLQFDPGFAVGVALAFALVYAEEGMATAVLFGRGASPSWTRVVILAATGLTFIGYFLSFVTLAGVRAGNDHLRAAIVWPHLFSQWPIASLVVFLTTAVVYVLYLRLAEGNPVAAYTLLKDLYLYALVGAGLTHGLVLYVRYAQIVYMLHQDNFLKVLAVSGGIAVMLLVLTLYLLALNLRTLERVPESLRGAWGLHIYGRAILVITLVLLVYGWHARWMADH
jgi:hypothetical protein